jgi:hypothetical protein
MPWIRILSNFVYKASGFDNYLQKKAQPKLGNSTCSGGKELNRTAVETAFLLSDDKMDHLHI